ncbi:MAG: TonB-dependent receptor [Rhizobacter sp.]|nr:TonB-dependent receptor [Ferruginibacter sp.]
MLRYLFLFIVFFGVASAMSQVSNGKISGIVIDSVSNTTLELATISIFAKDSTLVNYQLTDKYGNFSFPKLPLNRELRLDVSYVGYRSYKRHFKLDSIKPAQSFRIALPVNIDDSNAVVIRSVVPIRMNGDTLEINPAAFKMEKTAVAEELLNQVPGITIWADGTITVNGRPVPKILVDGKPFLSQTDPTIATQNLPKNAIEKIQVYQEVDRTKEQRDNTEQDSVYTMNIKLKANKKSGYFGKAGLGYGTDNRYESDGSFQLYNKTNSLSIGGGTNNINKSVGSIQQMLSNNSFRKINPNNFNVSSFGRSGISKTFSLGAVYTHDFVYSENGSRYNNISSNYNHTGNNNFVSGNTVQERTTKDFSQFIESSNSNNTDIRGYSAGITYTKSNSSSKNLNLSANSNFNDSRSFSNNFTAVKDSSKALQSTNEGNSDSRTNSRSGNISLALSNFSNVNPLTRFNLTVSGNFNNNQSERNTRSIFNSYANPAADTSYNRLYNNDQESMGLNFNLNYYGLRRLLFRRFNLFGVDLNLLQAFTYDQNKSYAIVNDYDSNAQKFMVNNGLTNNNKLQTIRYTPGVVFQKSFNKWAARYSRNVSLSLRLAQSIRKEMNSSSLAIRNVDRSFSFFTPSLGLNYNYGIKDKMMYNLSFGFNRNYTYPAIDQLYTITDSINVYNVRFGNPDLKNTRTDNVNFNFSVNKRKPKAKYEVNASVSGNMAYKTNPIADSVINDISGKRLQYTINAKDGVDYSLNYSANVSRKIRKNSLQLQYSGTIGNNRSTHFIDGIISNNRSRSFTHNVNLQYSLKTLLILKLAEVVSTYSSSQTGSGLSSYKVTNSSTQFGATVNYSKNLSFNTTVSTTDNSNVSNTVILWHAFSSYRFLKGKQGELKFSAFDLLKKFQNINTNTNIDGTSTTITNGLQQYFLLTFAYYPRKFGRKDSDD